MIEVSYIHWIAFAAFLVLMLFIDLGVLNRKSHKVSTKEAVISSVIWISLALIFNIGIFIFEGHIKGFEFLTGYLLEYSLSVDNIFVFVLLFTYFAVPAHYQHKVLFWGIIGAIIMRGILIAAGASLVMKFHWILYIFGIFLIITGVKMFFQKNDKIQPDKNLLVRIFKKYFSVKSEYRGNKFFIRKNQKNMQLFFL
jgi:tellurite resistance protein TerC